MLPLGQDAGRIVGKSTNFYEVVIIIRPAPRLGLNELCDGLFIQTDSNPASANTAFSQASLAAHQLRQRRMIHVEKLGERPQRVLPVTIATPGQFRSHECPEAERGVLRCQLISLHAQNLNVRPKADKDGSQVTGHRDCPAHGIAKNCRESSAILPMRDSLGVKTRRNSLAHL